MGDTEKSSKGTKAGQLQCLEAREEPGDSNRQEKSRAEVHHCTDLGDSLKGLVTEQRK